MRRRPAVALPWTRSEVDRLTLGTLHLCPAGENEAYRILDAFAAAGGRRIDTAWFYGYGWAERIVGSFAARSGLSDLQISTKIGHFRSPDSFRDPRRIRQAFARCLDRLGTIPAAIALHEADWACWWEDVPPGELVSIGTAVNRHAPAWETLTELAGEYAITASVTGNNADALRHVAESVGAGTVLVAKQYDLLWATAEPLLRWADGAGVRVCVGAPYHQGALLDLAALSRQATDGGDTELAQSCQQLSDHLDRHGLSVTDVAVPFLLYDARIASVCVGARRVDEVHQAVAATERKLPAERYAQLRHRRLSRPPRPGIATTDAYLPGCSR